MSKPNWTPDQEKAIYKAHTKSGDRCNLLVGAAAGSGKTAVLVERIIKKLIPDDITQSIDISSLLVVTFTKAAAHEMEERIGKALSSALREATLSNDIQRKKTVRCQQMLLSSANITTIDAFCLNIVRENFNLIDIDPRFSIADEAQSSLLAEEAMEEVFSKLYEENNQDFIDLLCKYASSRSDDGLSRLISYVHSFIQSVPYSLTWLKEKAEELKCPNGIKSSAWYKQRQSICTNNILAALEFIKRGISIMGETVSADSFVQANPPEKGTPVYDIYKSVYAAFYSDYLMLISLLNVDSEDICSTISNYKIPALRFPKDIDASQTTVLKSLRNSSKEIWKGLEKLLSVPSEDAEKCQRESLYPTAVAICELTEAFHNCFMKKKLDKGLLDFSDVEHLALKILSENPDVANEIKSRYSEILMDEYQDTSLLQEEIFKYVSNGKNLFMVGDMKQSIYRFRSSDPTIFKNKSDTFQTDDEALNQKIILSANFRSRKEVLDSVNDIFSAIMTEEAGELDYDDEQKLNLGNTTYARINSNYKSECCLIELPSYGDESDEEDDLTSADIEARFIAEEINRLKDEKFKVRDGDSYRDIENRDIVILMSSYKAVSEIYTSHLNAAGIECFVETAGYFDKNEVKLIISLLKIICNPYNDIPLLGVLRSPIFSFTDDELVIIRKTEKGKFYNAIKELINKKAELTDAEQLKVCNKCEHFYSNLTRWREYARYMSSDKLLWTLFEETDFYAFCGAIHGGEEAQANLRLLFERAKQYENNGFRGLFSFIKYIEKISQNDTDLSSAKLIGEGHDVVRIMTIHKSKGLEFPVVFIAGGAKKLRRDAQDSRILLHKDLGIGLDYIDFENNYRSETPSKSVIKELCAKEQASEDIRKLYVALTRAKEKLYFVASVKGINENGDGGLEQYKAEKAQYIVNGICSMLPQSVLSGKSFADWVMPVAMCSDNWIVREIPFKTLNKPQKSEALTQKSAIAETDIEKILNYQYPYEYASSMPTKISVSELKSKKSTELIVKPKFLSKKTTDGAAYGTAIHKVMQNLVPIENMNEEYVAACILDMAKNGILDKGQAERISPSKILKFYQSEIGKRIIKSKKVYREQPFEVRFPSNWLTYNGESYDLSIPENIDQEDTNGDYILLQGVIDCYFEEDEDLVLVDYKTDFYTDLEEIHQKYDKQLELYEYALKKITKKCIKNKFIYLFFDDFVV